MVKMISFRNMKFGHIPILKKILGYTNDLSFVLKPSPISGVGVFLTHGVKKHTKLMIFVEDESSPPRIVKSSDMKRNRRLKAFATVYGVEASEGIYVSSNFSHMEIGWYLNHSETPNAFHNENYDYFAARAIRGGEEVTIDYRDL